MDKIEKNIEFPFNTVITEENAPKWDVEGSENIVRKEKVVGVVVNLGDGEAIVQNKQEVVNQIVNNKNDSQLINVSKDFDKSKEKLSEVKIKGNGKEETNGVKNAEKIEETVVVQRNEEAIN